MVRHLSKKQRHWKNMKKSMHKLLAQINIDANELSSTDKNLLSEKGLEKYVKALRQSIETESSTPGGVADPLQSRVEVLSDSED